MLSFAVAWIWVVMAPLPVDGLPPQTFPLDQWETREPAALGMDGEGLERLARELGSRGCVIRRGYVLHVWGNQAERGDLYSSAKPVLSTLFFFAIKEGLVTGPDQPLRDFGWELLPKDQGMTFRHLGAMTSGYARPEAPGEAFAYNDYAIQLYQKTLFDRVFKGDPAAVAHAPNRFGALRLQDGLKFRTKNRRIEATTRDFARIAWLWCRQGNWEGRELLPASLFRDLVRPQVDPNLPGSRKAVTNDYLKIGTYGGESEHGTRFGAGIYGFNWWFNGTGRLHPTERTWPDAPPDTFMSLGRNGNHAAMIPSLDLVLVTQNGNWGEIEAGNRNARMNRILKQLVAACEAQRPRTP